MNNARNDLIAYYKVIGLSCDECAEVMGITLERVWIYWRLISINIIGGVVDGRTMRIDRDKYLIKLKYEKIDNTWLRCPG